MSDDPKKLLLAFIQQLDPAQVVVAQKAIEDSALGNKFAAAAENPLGLGLPAKAPALWRERTTGQKVSPTDFIHKYYGEWIGKGLTRAHIGQLDKTLYNAYAKSIKTHPELSIKDLPSEERVSTDDPVESLERRRACNRDAQTRLRAKKAGFTL